MTINTDINNGCGLLRIKGDIDISSSPFVRKAILNLTKKKIMTIIFNAENVTYMDTSAIATLIEGLYHSNKYKGRFVVVGLRDNIKELFKLTKMDRIFEI